MTPPNDPLDIEFDTSTFKRRSFEGAAVTFLAQSLKFTLQFSSQIVLARLLTPSEFGLVATLAPLIGFAFILNDLGIGQSIIRIATIDQKQISALFWLTFAVSLVLTATVLGCAPLMAWIYSEPRLVPVTAALASLIVLNTLAMPPGALLNRQLRFVSLAIADVGSLVVGSLIGIWSALVGFGYWSLVDMAIAQALTNLAITYSLSGWRPSLPERGAKVGATIRFGARLTATNLATYFSTNADNLLIGFIAGKAELGLYDRAYKLVVQPLGQVMVPMSRLAIPILAQLVAYPDRYQKAYLFILQLTLIACFPGLTVAIFLAEPIVRVLLGAAWIGVSPIFAWICVGGLASSIYTSTFWLFVTQSRAREQMYYVAVTSSINIASFGIGILWGAVGVAAVSAVSFVAIQSPILIWAVTRHGPVRFVAVGRAIVPFCSSAAINASILYVWTRVSHPHSLVDILLVLVVSYSAFCLALLCSSAGRQFFGNILGMRTWIRASAQN